MSGGGGGGCDGLISGPPLAKEHVGTNLDKVKMSNCQACKTWNGMANVGGSAWAAALEGATPDQLLRRLLGWLLSVAQT